ATQGLLDPACPQWPAAHAGQADRHVGHVVTADRYLGGDRHDRPVLRPPAELEVGPCAAGRWCCDADLANDLIGLQRRGKGVDEEVPCRDAPFTLGAHNLELRVEGQKARREMAYRTGMGGSPANRPPVADLWVADLGGGAAEQRQLCAEQVGE